MPWVFIVKLILFVQHLSFTTAVKCDSHQHERKLINIKSYQVRCGICTKMTSLSLDLQIGQVEALQQKYSLILSTISV